MIPLNVFQTWKSTNLPKNMKKNIISLRRLNPEFVFFLFDDNMCELFIKQHFDPIVLSTYKKLIPGAYKADLWRYCALYIHGGIYMDIKLESVNNFKLINLINKEHYPKDIISSGSGIWQGLLVCEAENKYLKKCIDQICINVSNNFIGNNPLEITGPLLMKKILREENSDVLLNSEIKLEKSNNELFLKFRNNNIFRFYKSYYKETKDLGLKHYSILWKMRKIYI